MLNRVDIHNKIVAAVSTMNPQPTVIFRARPTHNIPIPSIIYDLTGYPLRYANNKPYTFGEIYEIKCLSSLPGLPWSVYIFKMENTQHVRTYTEGSIVYDIFEITSQY